MNNLNINVLNDYCLIHIFEYLSCKEKLVLELVSKRWNSVSKLSWNHVTSFTLDFMFLYKNLCIYGDKTKNTAFLVQVLKRCGHYVNTLMFCGVYTHVVDVPQLMKKLYKYCHNITEIELTEIQHIPMETYSRLIINNHNIKSITLRGIEISTECLLNLDLNIVETFIFAYCAVDSKVNMGDILAHMKNIKILEICAHQYNNDDFDVNFALDGLNDGKIENLTELTLTYYLENLIVNKLIELLSRQKQLQKLELNNIPKELIRTILSLEHLQKITLKYLNDEFLSNLGYFKNLKSLGGKRDIFTDLHLQNVSKCVSLQELKIDTHLCKLTSEAANHFSKLENLEFLTLKIMEILNIDNSETLAAISKCKKLKKLEIFQIEFKEENEEEIENMEFFPALETFKIWYSNVTNKVLANVVLKSPKIHYFILEKCKGFNNEFVHLVDKITNDLDYKQILNIQVTNSYPNLCLQKDNLTNVSPRISLQIN